MLELKNIVKEYHVADETINALNNVSIKFRENEFVSILGPSGCGKTTLLNIIGGLDRYTSGDLIINGRSTKEYKDRDWDTYRNHSIGFIFQSYNLIPHQTVLENVELALTLAGVSKEERRTRAKEVLTKVGLGDKLNNRPNQLSGGQMQRVAIARALINDPDILLADEPTGALDTKTSIQILELLKEVASDRLIIMVTHNPELAEQYSTRIIKLLDGKVIDDSNPVREEEVIKTKEKLDKKKKASMSFFTALSLSFRNMLTKKGRTIMVAFAGSIGIIGIALILSVSYGFQAYIDRVEEDTLSSYPVMITEENTNMSSIISSFASSSKDENRPLDKIYSKLVLTQMLKAVSSETYQNNMTAFKAYIESQKDYLENYTLDIKYNYNITPYIYKADTNKVVQVNPNVLFSNMMGTMGGMQATAMSAMSSCFDEKINNQKLLETQYEVLAGEWPDKNDDDYAKKLIMVVDDNNEISDFILYALGIEDQDEMKDMIKDVLLGKEVATEVKEYTYEYMLNLKYKVLSYGDFYVQQIDTSWTDMSGDTEFLKNTINEKGIELSVGCIVRLRPECSAGSLTSTLMYSSELIDMLIKHNNQTGIVQDQLTRSNIDVFTGKQFEIPEITIDTVNALFEIFLASLPEEQRPLISAYFDSLSDEEKIEQLKEYIKTDATYEGNIDKLQYVDIDSPHSISLYPIDFNSKDKVTDFIADYNKQMLAQGLEANVINYTDYIGLFLNSVTLILNIITYVLIGFVSVSLIVSSIMIGVITYISVIERTKEIGILRSVGASKKDVSRVFNAETLIIGFASGVIGILVTLLLIVPINLIINHVGNIANIAKLPFLGAIILILISMGLTLIAGIFPARFASKCDPVEALRTE